MGYSSRFGNLPPARFVRDATGKRRVRISGSTDTFIGVSSVGRWLVFVRMVGGTGFEPGDPLHVTQVLYPRASRPKFGAGKPRRKPNGPNLPS